LSPAFWWNVLHNLVIHPLLVSQLRWAERLHEWSSDHLFDAVEPDGPEPTVADAFLGGVILTVLAGLLLTGAVVWVERLVALVWRGGR
jgi:hypothetical protein